MRQDKSNSDSDRYSSFVKHGSSGNLLGPLVDVHTDPDGQSTRAVTRVRVGSAVVLVSYDTRLTAHGETCAALKRAARAAANHVQATAGVRRKHTRRPFPNSVESCYREQNGTVVAHDLDELEDDADHDRALAADGGEPDDD